MITPINIALLGVLVLAAVALVVFRRRRSGASDEAASSEVPDETPAPLREPAPADADEARTVSEEPAWAEAEAAATLAPVREDEAETAADSDLDDDDEDEDRTEDEADDQDAQDDEQDEDTGGIEGLDAQEEPGATTDPDDGLGDIVTEPGWYLPGETDMTGDGQDAETGLLIPEVDLVISGDELEDEQAATLDSSALLLGESADGFDPAAGWAAPAEDDEEPAGPTWLGLGGDEDPVADGAAEDEISLEVTPSASDDLFALPDLAEGIPDEEDHDLDAPSFPLDRWEDPVTPGPSLAVASAPAEMTVTRHGPLTVSIDPAALLAIETEGLQRSTSRGEGGVSWELTLKVELRQRGDAPDTEAG